MFFLHLLRISNGKTWPILRPAPVRRPALNWKNPWGWICFWYYVWLCFIQDGLCMSDILVSTARFPLKFIFCMCSSLICCSLFITNGTFEGIFFFNVRLSTASNVLYNTFIYITLHYRINVLDYNKASHSKRWKTVQGSSIFLLVEGCCRGWHFLDVGRG